MNALTAAAAVAGFSIAALVLGFAVVSAVTALGLLGLGNPTEESDITNDKK